MTSILTYIHMKKQIIIRISDEMQWLKIIPYRQEKETLEIQTP